MKRRKPYTPARTKRARLYFLLEKGIGVIPAAKRIKLNRTTAYAYLKDWHGIKEAEQLAHEQKIAAERNRRDALRQDEIDRSRRLAALTEPAEAAKEAIREKLRARGVHSNRLVEQHRQKCIEAGVLPFRCYTCCMEAPYYCNCPFKLPPATQAEADMHARHKLQLVEDKAKEARRLALEGGLPAGWGTADHAGANVIDPWVGGVKAPIEPGAWQGGVFTSDEDAANAERKAKREADRLAMEELDKTSGSIRSLLSGRTRAPTTEPFTH